jgi:hypothetical protein
MLHSEAPTHASNARQAGSAVHALAIAVAHAPLFVWTHAAHVASGLFGLSAMHSDAAQSFAQFAGTHMQSMVAPR